MPPAPRGSFHTTLASSQQCCSGVLLPSSASKHPEDSAVSFKPLQNTGQMGLSSNSFLIFLAPGVQNPLVQTLL